ncbi:hypothetical protein EON81_28135 [bacterium]|nr:MAG: hypothetical protein EON81_28135 [bacterium]
MKQSSLSRTLLGATALAAVSVAGAQTIRRDTVIPIRFEDTIRLSNVRVGDTFRARVDDSRDLPRGAELEGKVRGVRKPRNGENGFVEMEFNSLRTSDGRRYDIRAVPIPLDDRNTTRGRDGRVTVKQNKGVNNGTAVLGGGLAGLAIGSLIKKPLEGAIVGVLGGILVAETSRSGNVDTVIDRNTRMGAAFTRDFRFEGSRDDWDRDRDRDRDGDWNRDRDRDRDDWNRDRDKDWDRDRDRNRDDDRWTDDGWGTYTPRIKYRDRDIRFNGRERPYRLGGTTMLPIEATARQLDIRIDDVRARTLNLDGPDGRARISRDSSFARIDGREVSLGRPVVERDGVLYAPAEVFGRILRDDFYIDGTSVFRRQIR